MYLGILHFAFCIGIYNIVLKRLDALSAWACECGLLCSYYWREDIEKLAFISAR